MADSEAGKIGDKEEVRDVNVASSILFIIMVNYI